MRSSIQSLLLTDFRSYARAELTIGEQSAFLFGPNGAGKTNLLEAISLLSPGRGLRSSSLAEIGRRLPGEDVGRPWAVSALVAGPGGETRIGTGLETAGSSRRVVRIDGEAAPPGRMADHVRPLWLTPAQDRLFLDPASERRKFFDRLVYAAYPTHAANVLAYERALRERSRLLAEDSQDGAWLTALEARMAEAGSCMAVDRARALDELAAEIDERSESAFPRAEIALPGVWESLAASGLARNEIEARLAGALATSRPRDRAAGRALDGPHRGDLAVRHRAKNRPAAECSTGEQKALVLNLVLAQAARLCRVKSAPTPIVLLDEVAAHLDVDRRAALFDEIEALGVQAFLTGTDKTLFATLKGRAIGVHVDAGALTVTED
jgi:DNA replication and repair protein RecF